MEKNDTNKNDTKKTVMRKKILFILPTLSSGGAERVILNIIKYLDRNKYEIFLVIINTRDAVYLKEIPENIIFIDLKCLRLRYSIFAIIFTIWKIRPNTIFSSIGHLNLIIGLLKFILPKNIKLIARETTFLNSTFSQYSFGVLRKLLFKRFYSNIDIIICQSTLMKIDLIRNFNIKEYKLIIIKNPIDYKNINDLMLQPLEFEMEGYINIVAVGRLVSVKGFDLLIKAIALINNPSIRLILIGDGPNLIKLKDLRDKLSLSSNQVYFAGYQHNPYNWIFKSSLFILSSRMEGFPNVILEALICGKFVISTPVGGVLDLFNEISQNGTMILTDDTSSESLTQAINDFISNHNEKSYDKVNLEDYYIENVIKHYYEIL